NKIFSIINIIGLAVGLGCLILISFFIQDEFSYDRFHKKAENIYRLTVADEIGAMPTWAGTPLPGGPTLKQNFRK
ncbi:ABC transporter permease, partial [Bacteroidota bacterium]